MHKHLEDVHRIQQMNFLLAYSSYAILMMILSHNEVIS